MRPLGSLRLMAGSSIRYVSTGDRVGQAQGGSTVSQYCLGGYGMAVAGIHVGAIAGCRRQQYWIWQ
eukprot:171753-Rhodomonas_salina.4